MIKLNSPYKFSDKIQTFNTRGLFLIIGRYCLYLLKDALKDINYELYNEFRESDREWIPFLFVVAGLSQRGGKHSTLNAHIVFDVLNSSKSPYRDWEPFYSVGVGVGF